MKIFDALQLAVEVAKLKEENDYLRGLLKRCEEDRQAALDESYKIHKAIFILDEAQKTAMEPVKEIFENPN